MILHAIDNDHSLQIKALEHLIDEDFDSQKSCHAVCHLLSQLFGDSDIKINRMIAELAVKALDSTVHTASIQTDTNEELETQLVRDRQTIN